MDKIQSFHADKSRLEKIIENYPIPMAIIDTLNNITYINNKFTELFGYSIDDVPSAEIWWKTVYPDEEYRKKARTAWEDAVDEARKNHTQFKTQDWDMVCKDGSVRHVEFDLTPIDNGSVISMNDVTKTKHTIDVLKDSEARFRELIDNSPYSIGIHDLNGVLIRVNKIWKELWGFENPEDFIGKHNVFTDPHIIALGYDKLIKEVLTGKTIKIPEVTYDPKKAGFNGRKRTVTTYAYPLRDENGHIKNFVMTHVDITDRKNAENEARELAAKWKATFEAMSSSVCIIDNHGNILECNSATFKMFNFSKDEIKDKHCWELVHGLSGPIENCPILRMQKSHKRESNIFKQNNCILEVTVDPIFDENGETSTAVHIVTDITPKRQIE
jgi:PAS domain S-box-containing protein